MTSGAIRFTLLPMKNGISPGADENRRLILIGADGFIGSFVNRHFRKLRLAGSFDCVHQISRRR